MEDKWNLLRIVSNDGYGISGLELLENQFHTLSSFLLDKKLAVLWLYHKLNVFEKDTGDRYSIQGTKPTIKQSNIPENHIFPSNMASNLGQHILKTSGVRITGPGNWLFFP
jgi:hypothetical protein